MLIFKIPKEEMDLISDVGTTFGNSEIVEVDSLGTDTFVQIIIPLVEIALPVLSTIIVTAITTSKKVEIEYDGIKIKGTEEQVDKYIKTISELEEKRKEKSKNNKKGKN